jgi:hypothetical protein
MLRCMLCSGPDGVLEVVFTQQNRYEASDFVVFLLYRNMADKALITVTSACLHCLSYQRTYAGTDLTTNRRYA